MHHHCHYCMMNNVRFNERCDKKGKVESCKARQNAKRQHGIHFSVYFNCIDLGRSQIYCEGGASDMSWKLEEFLEYIL